MIFQFAQFNQLQTLYLTANQIPITTTIHSSHKHTLHFTIKYTHFKTTNTHSLFYAHPYSIHSIPQRHQTIHNHSTSIIYSLSPFLYSLNHSSSHTHFQRFLSTSIYANHPILSTHLASFQTVTLFSTFPASWRVRTLSSIRDRMFVFSLVHRVVAMSTDHSTRCELETSYYRDTLHL